MFAYFERKVIDLMQNQKAYYSILSHQFNKALKINEFSLKAYI